MDSPPTSEQHWWFTSREGTPVGEPDEWTPAFIEISADLSELESTNTRIQGVSIPAQIRQIGGHARVVVPWDRSPAGRYQIEVATPKWRERRTVTIAPTKLTQEELENMVWDLETRMAPTIALALQRIGAFSGLRITPPGDTTLASEMHRIRVAVEGDATHRGLLSLVPEIARDPHRMLHTNEPWVKADRARRPSPQRLGSALSKPINLDDQMLPITVADRRVEHTYDVYENRLLKLFLSRLQDRTRRVQAVASDLNQHPVAADAAAFHQQLRRVEASAPFLGTVTHPTSGPSQVSMVLLKRPDYRAMLSAYQRFQRHMTVAIDDPLLDAPLSNVPGLYELWGTLKVAEALVTAAEKLGYRIDTNELVRRRGGDLRLVTRGATVRLTHPQNGTTVRFREQPSYGHGGAALHSISFRQIPDIAVEISRPHQPVDVCIFDPKYKLRPAATKKENQDAEEEIFPGGPKKDDIDKMHAYRDAIRRPDGTRAASYAAIMYPGESRTFAEGLEAVQCRPSQASKVEAELLSKLSSWLGSAPAAGANPLPSEH